MIGLWWYSWYSVGIAQIRIWWLVGLLFLIGTIDLNFIWNRNYSIWSHKIHLRSLWLYNRGMYMMFLRYVYLLFFVLYELLYRFVLWYLLSHWILARICIGSLIRIELFSMLMGSLCSQLSHNFCSIAFRSQIQLLCCQDMKIRIDYLTNNTHLHRLDSFEM